MQNSITTSILQHSVQIWCDEPEKVSDLESENGHIQQMIMDDYSSGELNFCDKEGNDGIRGWWEIKGCSH